MPVEIFDCICNHTSVFHYIERRIIVIHKRVRRSSPVGTVDIAVADADVTIRDDTICTMIVDYSRRARRSSPPIIIEFWNSLSNKRPKEPTTWS